MCSGAHHLGRIFAAHGLDVRLMSPEYVRPYVKAQKNDDRDAEGIAEAATPPITRVTLQYRQQRLALAIVENAGGAPAIAKPTAADTRPPKRSSNSCRRGLRYCSP